MTHALRSAATGIAVEESGACGFSSTRGAVAVLAHVKARPPPLFLDAQHESRIHS